MYEELVIPLCIFAVILYSIKKVTEVLKARSHQARAASQAKGIPLPSSAYEMFAQLEQGLDIQVQAIAERCNKDGKNPMEDIGYKTVLSQYQKVRDLRTKFESNPIYIIADQMGWPLVKALIPDAISMAKRWMKTV